MISKTQVSLKIFFDFATWPPFTEMGDAKNGGQVAKSKKIFRLTCVLYIIKIKSTYIDSWHPLNNRLYVTGFERTHLPCTQEQDVLFTITR